MGLLTTVITLVRYRIYGNNYVHVIGDGTLSTHHNVRVHNTKIFIYPGASLTIEEGCIIENATISIEKGECVLCKNVIIQNTAINIEDGKTSINHHAKVCCKRVWVRFGGELSIGEYTNINDGSEIRCDEKISIGAFNQISYNVRIWDTNTHNILSVDERRDLTVKKYPYFGYEESRPETAPVKIGDDCWIGERAAVLKGSDIGDGSIVGFDTFISGKKIPSYSRVINERVLKISKIH